MNREEIRNNECTNIYTTQKLNIQTILINNIFKIKIISKENQMKIVIGICHLIYIRNIKIILFQKKNHM